MRLLKVSQSAHRDRRRCSSNLRCSRLTFWFWFPMFFLNLWIIYFWLIGCCNPDSFLIVIKMLGNLLKRTIFLYSVALLDLTGAFWVERPFSFLLPNIEELKRTLKKILHDIAVTNSCIVHKDLSKAVTEGHDTPEFPGVCTYLACHWPAHLLLPLKVTSLSQLTNMSAQIKDKI